MNMLQTKLEKIPRFSQKYVEALKKLNIETVEDFLLHFPFRYEDYSERIKISDLEAGTTATVMGEVVQSKLVRTWKRKMMITECFVADETATVRAVWFNQPYISDSLTAGKGVRLSGKVSEDAKGLFFSNPAWELSSRTPTNTGRLVPIYPETEGLTSKWIRWQMQNLIQHAEELVDPLPENILKGLHLPSLSEAVKFLHFPKTLREFETAQKRFAFQQMFLVQLATQRVKISWDKQNAVSIPFDEELIKKFVANLPFTLTNAQRKSAFQIMKDLEKPLPMNRLLNGDVGSGKTIVAALASLSTINAGFQVSLMAPTEVLALQHFESISKLFASYKISVGLLTNSYQLLSRNVERETQNVNTDSFKKISRKELLEQLVGGKIDIVVGTHALIQDAVKFKNLALVIVDEQHRFGVAQRAYLQQQIATELTHTDLTRTNTDKKDELLYEKLTYKIRGAAFEVKKQLGLGHKENIYQKALAEEFLKNGVPFKKEVSIDINYNNKKLGTYRPDFIIDNSIILELKSLPSIGKFEKQQVWHYLKGSNYKLALLINFGHDDVKIERFINTGQHKSVSSPHKSVLMPHFLSMTATPIPRTLTLAYFGNLDLSVLNEMPKNRLPIITEIVLPSKRSQVYDFVRSEIAKGHQAFIIFPLVEESEKLTELKAATQEHERLSREIFPKLNLGLLHGRLKSAEKEKVMQDFKDKKYDILVATSVVEVGIDIPNATLIMIEDAERFGLSQLHQFRGRVGRSDMQSYCFLFTGSKTTKAKSRLGALEQTSDGFKIAEEDLKLRGPGEFLGTRQSGLPDIAMEHLSNVKLIEIAHDYAEQTLENSPDLKEYPLLQKELGKFQSNIHLE